MPKLTSLKKDLKKDKDFPHDKLKTFLENMENSMMSESSLKKDWLSSEEEEAWKYL